MSKHSPYTVEFIRWRNDARLPFGAWHVNKITLRGAIMTHCGHEVWKGAVIEHTTTTDWQPPATGKACKLCCRAYRMPSERAPE